MYIFHIFSIGNIPYMGNECQADETFFPPNLSCDIQEHMVSQNMDIKFQQLPKDGKFLAPIYIVLLLCKRKSSRI